MKNCHRCGTAWRGYGPNPRFREVCRSCGAYLHSCLNCRHFDHQRSYSCKLKESEYVGPRQALNYCELFSMADSFVREAEARVEKARDRWEALFRK